MARIIVYIVAAVVVFLLLWMLFTTFLHALMLGFWILLVALLAFGMFRIGRRSGRGSQG